MSALYDTLRQMIRRELASHRFAEIGTVQAVYPSDPGPYSADVVLRGTELVLRHVPVATPRKGFASLPEVGDLVLVQFIGGALDRPVVTGTLYNESDTPPENVENDWVLQLPSGSDAKDSGVRVEIRQSSPIGFTVSLKGDRFKMEVQDDDPVMTLTVADAKVTIDGGGAIKIEAPGDLDLKAAGKLTLKADGDATIESRANLVLKGAMVKIN